ncbi:hypothetical protein ACFL6G_07505 [candidate division KSB1 bacterium]
MFGERTSRLEDSCSHCSHRIYIEAKEGKITEINNESVIVLRGGG